MIECVMILWGDSNEDISIYLVTPLLFNLMLKQGELYGNKYREHITDFLYANDKLNPGVFEEIHCQGGVVENIDLKAYNIQKIYSV